MSEKPKQEQIQKSEQEHAESGAVQESNLVNSIPEILKSERIITPSDLEEWKKLSTFDRLLFFQKTPKQLVKERKGWKKPDGSYEMLKYVEANVMQQEANITFLFKWSSEVTDIHYLPDEVIVSGFVEVEFDDGKTYRKACGGSGKKKNTDMLDWGDALKTAISEMEKYGLKKLGFNGDVYRGDV